jgi:hypothetical protein
MRMFVEHDHARRQALLADVPPAHLTPVNDASVFKPFGDTDALGLLRGKGAEPLNRSWNPSVSERDAEREGFLSYPTARPPALPSSSRFFDCGPIY